MSGELGGGEGLWAECTAYTPRSSLGLLPLVDELLQSGTFRHQLWEATSEHHEGQDGQEVVGTAAGRRRDGWGLWGQGAAQLPHPAAPAQPLQRSWACQLLSLHWHHPLRAPESHQAIPKKAPRRTGGGACKLTSCLSLGCKVMGGGPGPRSLLTPEIRCHSVHQVPQALRDRRLSELTREGPALQHPSPRAPQPVVS